jgi:glycosyltransferase involved in cell wall biosynthesis
MALSEASRPRVLLVHNAYQQRGGEDSVVEAELALLREGGHAVETCFRHNDEVAAMSRPALLANTLWSRRTVDELDALAQRFRPDVIHVHNTHPLVSPSVFWAAAKLRVPVVQTLHNFRLLCPQGMLLRDEKVCEDCLGHVPWRGVWHRCYRGSAVQSAVVAATVTLHRAAGTWQRKVSRYIALNNFCRDKFVQGGLPAERMRIKPNFVDVPAPEPGVPRSGGLFVGRLSTEKGVGVLARALAAAPQVTLSVIGTGELEGELRAVVRERMLGFLPLPQILTLMQRASWLVVPSIWYENFPRTIVEAYACGLPVIASRLGALPELVEDGRTGLLFEPGSADDLARKLQWAHGHPDEMRRMGDEARARYETMYTPERNLAMLNEIYADAIDAERRDA